MATVNKVTYEQVYAFLMMSHVWLSGGADRATKTKLGYALSRVRLQAEKLWSKFNTLVEDLNIDYCVVDDKGVIELNNGEFKFTREGQKKRNSERRILLESYVEIEPYYATQLPDDLTVAEQDAFVGFVMRELLPEKQEYQATEAEAQAVSA